MSTLTIQKKIFRLYRNVRQLTLAAFVLFILTICVRWIVLSKSKTDFGPSERENLYLPRMKNNRNGRPDLPKYIHLDLKGAPPKAEKFFESFFIFLTKLQMGVKGVVIEYEDTLPLQGSLTNATHRYGYTKSDIQLIEQSAKRQGLDIIPLIQTFGHLEWILKLREFESYRDDPKLPTVISPCVDKTYSLLEDLVQQTLDMHPNSQTIHIGCDEVIVTNTNPSCEGKTMSSAETYIQHIRRIIDIVRKIRPQIRILIWDDILRGDSFLRNRKLLKQIEGLIEPVSWNYFPTFDDYYKSLLGWRIYPRYFKTMWAASAFKGGLHRYSLSTNTKHHVSNNRQWLHFLESPTFRPDSFSGIILTGWSRFDHFMPLCDILPTAYPSLLYSLHALNTDEYLTSDSVRSCTSIWASISFLTILLPKVERQLKILDTIVPQYNRKHSFVRRVELQSRLNELSSLSKDLTRSKQTAEQHLNELYSKDVVDEWIDLYFKPIEDRINTTFTELIPEERKLFWERRPLT
ncbi:unnamed protein product [Adineta ricciae]|uniref:beta-N-acetylhexosaminidase n=1 Tax=Adineta ricciae TaxID=249248 RepID=A0A814USH1_ADIRI|nr:unnamed protein product [Adineta ricciae]